MGVEYRVLGPLEVLLDGEPVAVPAGRGRVLLATLLLRANRFTSVDELVERVWEGEPPNLDRAHKTLQTVVMRLRQALGAANCVRHESGGYLAEVEPGQLDLLRFRALVAEQRFGPALELWRGPVLGNVASESLHRDDVPPLVEEQLGALEQRIDADLAAGRAVDLVPELQELTRRHPLRDRFWAHLMLALYRSGQQAGALSVYRQVSEMFADELGVDPAPALSELHEQILRGEVAPPEEKRVTPRQLPPDLSTFAGREEDVGRLATSGARVLVISGTGGVGKTALAVHWAHRIGGRFDDGQIFVNLRGQDPVRAMPPQEALTLVLKGLGVDSPPVDPDEQVALYRSLVADRKFLLLLDNAANAEQVRPLLPASADALTLVTSRGDLRGLTLNDADLVRLPTLGADGGMRLLERVLGEGRVSAEGDAAASLVRLCAGLPLALRIAAADLRAQDSMLIADKVAQLDADRLGELAVPGDPGAAVSAVFDESYSALPEDARLVLRRLGVLPGVDFTANDAAVISGLPTVRRHLNHLVAVHLVEQRGDRFALHDLLRVYARERCGSDEVTEAIGRLYDFYRRMTDTAAELMFPDQRRFPLDTATTQLPDVVLTTSEQAYAWMTAEYENLVSTVVAAAEQGDHRPAAEIGVVLSGFCYEIRDDTSWSALCEIRLSAARESGDDVLIADASLSTAAHRYCQGDFAQAAELGRVALELGGRSGNHGAVASAHTVLGAVARVAGDSAVALHHLGEALSIHEQMGSVEGQALVLVNMGTVSYSLPDLLAAEQKYLRALELSDSPALHGHVHASLNSVYLELGRLPEVIAHQDAYLAVQAELGNPRRSTLGTSMAVRARRALGEEDAAFDLMLEVLDEMRLMLSFDAEADVWNSLAELFHECGEHEDALAAANLQIRISDPETMVHDRIAAGCSAARSCRELGDYEAAARHLSEVRALVNDEHLLGAGDELKERALLHLALGETAEALSCAEEAVATHRRYHQRYLEGQSLRALASARRATGDIAGAEAAEALAADAHRDCGVPERLCARPV
ncbi:AfsR/SARP family transcriptional regulator [Lentzea sp. NEAU-D7]|uniref:AfsR/SARP family transcriptional regulator n=1 Tax=Lentzea sp. NEAU-D7 TaxID=2994667 RepID=UPI00224AE4FC|nr:BTAD domain-containing putative transcriptional regulator [Lentzea sp. NEAU-D7]MCX2952053.1 BTAD domain-containing putative transcriptional regulator [Lentzea sp. NEAU-D7]MCX2954394.1 BTAD domain-containing putative transcriptional regulator [Lentzea sp. NEAU-D7]